MEKKRGLIEVCVDSMASVRAAIAGGADRLELCANLMIGGTTPSAYLIREAAAAGIPVHVLIRPRFGDFLFSQDEKREQIEQIAQLRSLGASGVVIGALTREGKLDEVFLRECAEAAEGLKLTLHRAFDVCRDPEEALEKAIETGFHTILTSGQKATAGEGAELIARLTTQARERIDIMPGSGVNAGNIARLAEKTGAQTFHLSAKKSVESGMVYRKEGVPMGLAMMSEYERLITDEHEVRAARCALDQALRMK